MKFFICKDRNKFTKDWNIESFGDWFFIRDDKVSIHISNEFIVLYCGYLIEGDIHEVAANFSFHEQNGNFFAVKLTKDKFEISLDYFNNHKVFVGRKYGTEISNWLPYMTIQKEDITRNKLTYDYLSREITPEECTTFFEHITSYLPPYDYMGDAKNALEEEKWDIDELTEYIYDCMLEHANVIKNNYPNRFISMSEGIDSAIQSQLFKEDTQYCYHLDPCNAEEDGLIYKQKALSNYPNTSFYSHKVENHAEYTKKYLRDSSTRWASFLPTFYQIENCQTKPDIVMNGCNADEMFFRDLTPHLHRLCLKYYDKDSRYIKQKIVGDIEDKKSQYGSTYTLGTHMTTDTYIDIYLDCWLRNSNSPDFERIKYEMIRLMTPKMYTRAISANNDIMCGSIYNDRRIYHEVFKTSDRFLDDAMDSPIQRKILDKLNFNFETPRKDVVYADYEGIFDNIFDATVPHCLEQNL